MQLLEIQTFYSATSTLYLVRMLSNGTIIKVYKYVYKYNRANFLSG